MRAIWTIAKKDLLILWRDKAGMFWVLGFPLLMALFFGSIFSSGGGPGPVTVGIVNEDQSGYSKTFVEELRKSGTIKVRPMPLDSARQLVRAGKLSAYLRLSPGFGDSWGFSFKPGDTTLEVGIDPSKQMLAGMLDGIIMQTIFTTAEKQLVDRAKLTERADSWIEGIKHAPGMSDQRKQALANVISDWKQVFALADSTQADSTKPKSESPSMGNIVAVRKVDMSSTDAGPRTSWEITFPSSVFWALIGCCAAFAISIVTERTRGTFLRLRLAPISRTQVLAGKGLACFISSVSVAVLLLGFGALVFHIRILSVPLMLLAVIASAVCFVGLMMIISVLGRTEQAVSGSGWGILIMISMLGGGMLPLAFMPGWMQSVSNISPMKWGILAVEGAVWRGFTFTEMLVPVGILLAIGVFFFSLGAWILGKQEG
jgi:ABC-2 type transport system permease protein